MNKTLLLSLATVLAGSAFAQSVKLTPVTTGGMKKIGFYMPQRLQLSAVKPDSVKKAPDAQDAMYGSLDIAGTKHVVLVAGDKIYVDTNGNGDLTDDPMPTWKASQYGDTKQFTMYGGNAMVAIPIAGQTTPVSLGIYKFDKTDAGRPQLANTLLYYSDYALEGKMMLGGKSYNVLVADLMATGFKPNTSKNDKGEIVDSGIHLLIDVNGNGKFDRRGENYDAMTPFNIGGTTYELSKIGVDMVSVKKSDKTVAEILPPPDLGSGKKAMAFAMKTTEGATVKFPEAYKGKLVMLDFWATWCGPCKGEIPGLAKAFEKYHPQGFEILGISLDNQDTVKGLAQFTKDWNMPWPQIADAKYWKAEVAQLYVVESIPAAFLVDGDTGEIIASGDALRGEMLVPTLEKALARKKSGGK